MFWDETFYANMIIIGKAEITVGCRYESGSVRTIVDVGSPKQGCILETVSHSISIGEDPCYGERCLNIFRDNIERSYLLLPHDRERIVNAFRTWLINNNHIHSVE